MNSDLPHAGRPSTSRCRKMSLMRGDITTGAAGARRVRPYLVSECRDSLGRSRAPRRCGTMEVD